MLSDDCVNIIEEFERNYFENKDTCDGAGIGEIMESRSQSFNHFKSIIKRVVEKGQDVDNEVIYLSLFQFYSDYKRLDNALEKLSGE